MPEVDSWTSEEELASWLEDLTIEGKKVNV